jgi:serine/threonine protein kinase
MKDYYEDADYIYIVMDYIKGRDLFDYLKYNNTKMTEEKAKAIAYNILVGIQYLHNYGIIHRDLKLENIMMTDKTDAALPLLVDFGLATIVGPG